MPPIQNIVLNFIGSDGATRQVDASPGRSLMQAAVAAGIDAVVAECGGTLSCATCHVIVAPDWVARLPPVGADEDAMLEMTASPREAGSRLSCQVALTPELDGLVVQLPDRQY